jgi:UDPglucose 6-dehydrogenase
LYKKACKRLITFSGLKVAVLGVTFKPGTDDLREAPSLENIPLLLEQGADIHLYDPVGMDNFKKLYPEGLTYADSAREALEGAQACFILTEWQEFKEIKPEEFKRLMRTALVYDGKNLFDLKEMKNANVEYYSIGRSL